MKSRWKSWTSHLEQVAKFVRSNGGEIEAFEIGDPAPGSRVVKVEQTLGRGLPEDFRSSLLEFSARLEFYWAIPEELEDSLGLSVLEGGLGWSLDGLVEKEAARRQDVADEVFGSERLRNALVWATGVRNSFGFDLRMAHMAPVVLLGDGGLAALEEDTWLAPSFVDFIDRWIPVGFLGEAYQVDDYLASDGSGLDEDCDEFVAFRRALAMR